jgi:hypothetical protein
MKKAFANLTGDLAGTYYPLTGMEEKVGEGYPFYRDCASRQNLHCKV